MQPSVKRYRLASLLLAGLMLGTGCGPSAPETSLVPVRLPALEGLPEAARQQLQRRHAATHAAAEGTPAADLATAYGELGQLLFTYDFLDAAEPAFLNARSLRPADEQWSYYLGILYRQRGAFEQATGQFERVLERNPDDVFARLRLAEARLELGRTEAAETHLKTALAASPRNAFAHFLLGQIAYEAGAFEEAAAHYETVLDVQPAATQVHAPLGLAYRNLGNEERSRYHLARRGQALVRLDDPRVLALEALKQASGATALTRGQQLIDAGRYREAVAALEQATAQDPASASAFLSLGVARSYAGDQAGAVEAFQRVLRLDASESKAYYNLGALFAAGGQRAQAEQQFRAALAHDPHHRNAHLELAELLRRSGRCGEAVAHFERTLEITPGDVAARQHLALCHLRQGRYADARALLEDGLAARPDHLGFVDALARVLAAGPDAGVRDAPRALQLAEQALALQRRTETLETVAMAHAALGRFDEAAAWQQEAIRAAEEQGHDGYLDHLRENLRRYRQHTPSRTPWPDFMYEL